MLEKFFVTKSVLSTGKINECRLEISENDSSYGYNRENGWSVQYVIGRNAFRSYDDAISAAEKARKRKIESLRKQIKKLEAMSF